MREYCNNPKTSWRKLYKAALFEADKTKIAERISDAERDIVARLRSLFHHKSNVSAERRALDAAVCALSVLNAYTRLRQYKAGVPGPQQLQRSRSL